MPRAALPSLLLAGLLLAGCLGPASDEPELVRVRNEGGLAEGNATLRFEPIGDAAPVEEVPLALRAGDLGEFTVDLTSDVRDAAVLAWDEGALRSEPFVTGLGDWRVEVILQADRIHVVTIHGD